MTLEAWPDAIEAVLAKCTTLRTLTLLRQTASTQDAARAAGAPIGTVIVAGRQTDGRGRLGRTWCDTGDAGVAVTFVVARAQPERLAMLSAVAAAEAINPLVQHRAQVKWPNDLILNGRKLGGVLVEQLADRALIGIGINVSQTEFPPPLAESAISLAQAGANTDRLQVVCRLTQQLDRWLLSPMPQIAEQYLKLERMTGRHAAFQTPSGVVHGTVITVDPERGLVVATPEGVQFLPAATTSVVQATP